MWTRSPGDPGDAEGSSSASSAALCTPTPEGGDRASLIASPRLCCSGLLKHFPGELFQGGERVPGLSPLPKGSGIAGARGGFCFSKAAAAADTVTDSGDRMGALC